MDQIAAAELRHRAEERYRQHSSQTPPPHESDLRRLMAELQIHQCELEIQNEELLRARAETENWLKGYADLYDFAPVSYFTLEPDGTILQANLAGAAMLGVTRAELRGRRFGVFVAASFRKTFSDYLDSVFSEQQRLELAGMLAPGSGSPLHVQIQAIAADDGRSCRAVALDLSDRKRAEAMAEARRQEERARLAAEEANAAKDRFLAVLSHELRTPLTPVLAAVSILERHPGLDQDARDRLQVIRRNIDLEARLIDDLLDLTCITRGKIDLDKRPTDLCSVVRLAVDVCRSDIENRGLNLVVDLGGPCFIEADEARIEQVVWNLLKNAVKFTPGGGSIAVRCRAESGQAVIEVSDTGMGIDLEAMDRIFNAFEQGEKSLSRQYGGLGLGLAIARSLVELHDGTIEAFSCGKGTGATFTVRLPLAASRPTGIGEPVRPAAGPLPARRRLRLLLVEDHGDTAEMLQVFLTHNGYEVHRVGDVTTALTTLDHVVFDLLVSDLGLPDGSGIDLMQTLRERGRSLPGVALTGYGRVADVQATLQAGFAAHVVKPIDMDRLLQVLGEVSERAGLQP